MDLSNGRARGWAGRAGFVVAALACVATSRPRWHLDTTPPPVPSSPGQGLLLTVEASHPPELSLRLDTQSIDVQPMSSASASSTYFVPPGASITRLAIEGHDGRGGGMCSELQPPTGAFLRVSRTEPIATWHQELTGPKQTLALAPGAQGFAAASLIEFEAAQGLLRVKIAWSEPQPTGLPDPYVTLHGSSGGRHSYKVYWPSPPASATARWAPRVLLDGPCPDAQPCAPPPDALRALTVRDVPP